MPALTFHSRHPSAVSRLFPEVTPSSLWATWFTKLDCCSWPLPSCFSCSLSCIFACFPFVSQFEWISLKYEWSEKTWGITSALYNGNDSWGATFCLCPRRVALPSQQHWKTRELRRMLFPSSWYWWCLLTVLQHVWLEMLLHFAATLVEAVLNADIPRLILRIPPVTSLQFSCSDSTTCSHLHFSLFINLLTAHVLSLLSPSLTSHFAWQRIKGFPGLRIELAQMAAVVISRTEVCPLGHVLPQLCPLPSVSSEALYNIDTAVVSLYMIKSFFSP